MDKKPFRTTRPLASLRAGRNDWYRIKAQAEGPALVHIFDEIGYFGVTAQDFTRDLAAVKGDVELHLNSPGGEVFDGIAIYNALRNREGTVSVVIDSLAASIASVIAMAASPGRLEIARNGTLMIHDGFGMAIGNAADMREMADLLDKTSDNIADIYSQRTGQAAGEWRGRMRAETWYVGQEAVSAGLADRLHGAPAPEAAVAASWDLSVFARRPAEPVRNEKYSADDRKRMASSGEAMDDGSYPVADSEDLDNAIHAVGRGGADHDAIRRHIIKRAQALGLSSRIPDDWNSDGSLKSPENHTDLSWIDQLDLTAFEEALK